VAASSASDVSGDDPVHGWPMPLGEAFWLWSWLGEPCSSSSERLSAHGLKPKTNDAFSCATYQPTNTTHAGRDWIPHFD
jgi:hypothetical protein